MSSVKNIPMSRMAWKDSCLMPAGMMGSLLVAPDDPSALATGLAELLDDPDRARELGALGREAVRDRYTLARMARDVAAVLDAVTSAQPA